MARKGQKYKPRKLAPPLDLRARLRWFRKPIEGMSCLDLGCGKNDSPISKQVLEIPWRILVSIDAWGENINVLHAKHAVGEMAAGRWISYTEPIENIVPRLPKKAYDIVLLLDILEHLKKDKAFQLLKDIEALEPNRIIIWLPLGNCPQGELDGNPYEVHRSTWEAGDLENLLYKVDVYPKFHKHLYPPVDAAWAVKTRQAMRKTKSIAFQARLGKS